MFKGKSMLLYILILAILCVALLLSMAWFNYFFQKNIPSKLKNTIESSSVNVLGSDIRYKIHGTGETTVILLHGFGGSLQHWEKIQPRLTSSKSIALDLVGFGESDSPLMKYDLETQRRYLVAFMDKLNIKTAVLVGTSMGGSLAAWTAAKSKDRVSGLILLAPSGYPGSFTPTKWPLNWFLKPGIINQLSLYIVNNSIFTRLFPHSLAIQALTASSSYNTAFSAALENIQQPTLLAMSRGDTAIDFSYHAKYKEKIPHLEFFEIPKSIGHVVLHQYPTGTANLINNFLNKH